MLVNHKKTAPAKHGTCSAYFWSSNYTLELFAEVLFRVCIKSFHLAYNIMATMMAMRANDGHECHECNGGDHEGQGNSSSTFCQRWQHSISSHFAYNTMATMMAMRANDGHEGQGDSSSTFCRCWQRYLRPMVCYNLGVIPGFLLTIVIGIKETLMWNLCPPQICRYMRVGC